MGKNAPGVPQQTDTNGDTNMKTLIAASIVLASGFAQAQSFDYEKAVGSHDLSPTLINDQAASSDGSSFGGFPLSSCSVSRR